MVVVEDLHQGGDLLRLHGLALQAADLAHVPRGAQEGQLVPAGEGRIVAVGDGQDLAEGLVARPLAERRRDQVVDDPVVEGVAGHADAGPPQGLGPEGAGVVPAKADDREVAGAAAEVAHQDGGVGLERAGEEEGRAHRLIDIEDFRKSQAGERRLVAGQRQLGLRRGAGEGDRAPDNDPAGQVLQRPARMVAELEQEGREQVFEGVAPAQNLGLGEVGRGREGLEGLDEPRLQRVLHIGLDGPGAGLHRAFGGLLGRGVEGQGRAEGEELALGRRKPHQPGRLARQGEGHDGVGGAEVHPQGEAGGGRVDI